jgi:uncharacterized membrane protein YdbT with pleckstrin-like domain
VEQLVSGHAFADLDNQSVAPDAPSAPSVLLMVRHSFWDLTWHVVTFLVVVPLLIAYVPRTWWQYGWLVPVLWFLALVAIGTYKRFSFAMRIYADRVSVVEGFWSKESSEFFIRDIRSIDVKQGIWARIVNIGDVTISTAASVEGAEEAASVARPRMIKDLLISLRQKSAA